MLKRIFREIRRKFFAKMGDSFWECHECKHYEYCNHRVWVNEYEDCNYWKVKSYKAESLKCESEDNRMEKLIGFKNVVVIEQGCGYNTKDYFYALYDDNIYPGDKVLVSGSASGQIWTVKDVIDYDESVITKNITAEVICKVDTADYDNRCANRKEVEKLRKEMDKKRKEIEARKDDEYYASLDDDYKAMLEQMKKFEC